MAYTRRQELMCTEDQMIAKPNVVLRKNEAIYIKMNDGTLRQKLGDGATTIINLPFTKVFDGNVVQTKGDSETSAMSQKSTTEYLSQHDQRITKNDQRITKNDKRITNLEQGLPDDNFMVDETVAYTKDVPANAWSYAEIQKIGGMTYKDGDTLRSAKGTGVEIVGANLFGGEALANKIKSEVGNSTLDKVNKTISYYASGISEKTIFSDFKPNTQYTLIFKGSGSAKYTNLKVQYTDGTETLLPAFSASNVVGTVRLVTDSEKSVEALQGVYYDGQTTLYYEECGIFKGEVTTEDFKPYVKSAFPIPEAVQALDGYGQSNPDNALEFNYIDFKQQKFVAFGHIVDGSWVAFNAVQETDISDLITADNLIGVEGNGMLTFVNEHGYAVPSEVVYQLKGATA